MKSIQRNLAWRLVIITVTLFAAAGAGLYLYVGSRLTREFDRALLSRAQLVSGMVLFEDAQLEFTANDAELEPFRGGADPAYFEIWAGDKVFSRSPSLGSGDLALPSTHSAARRVTLPNGLKGREISLQFHVRIDSDDYPAAEAAHLPIFTVVLAQDTRELDETLSLLASSLILMTALIAAASVLAVVLSVRRGLGPLHELAREVDAIGADSMHYRFAIDHLPAELRPIAQRLNELLLRLEKAFSRERRFTADVAHELRTPIAELRSMAEVALRWLDDAAAEQNYRDALAIATQMESLVTTLLSLARCEARSIPVMMQQADLCKGLSAAWEPHRAQAETRALRLHSNLPASLLIQTDPALMSPLLSNLLSNAATYTSEAGEIWCELAQIGSALELSISNTQSELVTDDLEHLFQPFWRKDRARTSGAGSGLGLCLVNAYAKLLGIEVVATLPRPGIFRISLKFPPTSAAAKLNTPVWRTAGASEVKAV